MKKILRLVSVIIVLVMIFPIESISAIASVKPYKNAVTQSINVQKYYEDIVNSIEWQTTISRKIRGEMLQLPKDAIESMSTDELIEAVLNYPFFHDIYAFDDIQMGFDKMFDSFNGVRELAKRNDVASELLRMYSNEEVLTKADTDVFRLTNFEVLLSQSFVLSKLDENQKNQFETIVRTKYFQKSKSKIYGEYTRHILFSLIMQNSDDSNMTNRILSIQNIISDKGNRYDPTCIYTPNGTLVYSTVNIDEPLSQQEINENNYHYDTYYPYATRLRSSTGKYNCHSYAWYNQGTSNNRWISDPSAYWTDGSYTYSSYPSMNYKAVYWAYGTAEHSAIVYQFSGGYVIMKSKWGSAGLYLHREDDSPYYSNSISYYHL